ncbi:hypothetical protein E4U43_007516 [Claviceps pusilla]|uniref:BTB domain-containing protein n=1 Tax=Claviceps pusilla TaxID=123648 RepID=A0A9P7NES9_9HYPO|nr:hypothetical protein E4U43_007516 [Claviceps pusilla]
MFSRRFASSSSSARQGHKTSGSTPSFSRDNGVSKRRHEHRQNRPTAAFNATVDDDTTIGGEASSAIVTIVVGPDQRLFAAHEDILCSSPFFDNTLRNIHMDFAVKKIALPNEEPEIFGSVLEYLYKGDYVPRLTHNQHRDSYELEPANVDRAAESTVYHRGIDGDLLKDTVIYCAAQKYGLEELKMLALRKQGLQSGIQCGTLLASARYAYAHTPDTDSKLRAHYLALIIRCRSTFKRSGTMQLEMYNGGTQLFFDLFVAMCNNIDDISSIRGTPRD